MKSQAEAEENGEAEVAPSSQEIEGWPLCLASRGLAEAEKEGRAQATDAESGEEVGEGTREGWGREGSEGGRGKEEIPRETGEFGDAACK